MRWPLALGALAVAGAVLALVLAVRSTQDPVPGLVKDCVREGGARLARGVEGLGVLRADAEAGRARDGRRLRLGDDEGVLIERPGYSVLVVRTPDNPPFSGDVGRQAYLRPTDFAVVAVESGDVDGVLAGCAALAARRV